MEHHGADAPDADAMCAGAVPEAGDLDGDDGHRSSGAKRTVEQFLARAIRLYRQAPGETSRLRPVWIVPAALGPQLRDLEGAVRVVHFHGIGSAVNYHVSDIVSDPV